MKYITTIAFSFLLPFSLFLSSPEAFAYTSPGRPTGHVNDFAGILNAEEKAMIDGKLVAIEQSTGAQVAVVTVRTIGDDETIETYAEKLFREWGIGSADRDTGLLLLVAVDDRQMRIEVGYGLEGAVTDIQSGNIIRQVLTPAFQAGEYGQGISSAVDALSATISGSPEAAQYSAPSSQSSNSGEWSGGIFFLIIVVFNIMARLLGKTKSWWLGGVIGAVIGAIIGLIASSLAIGISATVLLTLLGLLFDYVVSRRPPGSGGGHGGFWPIFLGGGRGGGFGGGGFGGFGGGMSGGGGASGRW